MGLDATVFVLDEYGPVNPALSVAPIHFPEVRTTDGLGIEEGTTNLILNPRAVGLSNWGAANGTLSGPDAFGVVTVTAASAGSVGVLINTATGTNGINTLSVFTDTSRTVRLDYGATSADIASGARRVATINDTAGTRLGISILGVAAGEKVRLWLPQVEFKPYVTSAAVGDMGAGYAFTGTPNASSSTRVAADLRHTMSPLTGPLTLSAHVRVGITSLTVPNVITALLGGTGAPGLFLSGRNAILFTSGVDVAGTLPLIHAPGDLLFVAGTLDSARTGYTAYASRNGGALLSSAVATSGTVQGNNTVVQVGASNAANQANSAIEQLLIHNRVLSPAELTALATGGPIDYPDDLGVVYATGTKGTRGTLTALTAAGTGRFRVARSLPANFDRLSELSSAPYAFGTGATHRVSVPPGSGVGVGQQLGFVRDGERFKVVNAYAPGGQYDELYCAQVA